MRFLLAIPLFTAPALQADTPSFRHDILPILSKKGCNTGGCHGALAGKGGFRLSLFGYDPERDYQTITREMRGRRVEFAAPARSLLLTKPTTSLAHKGAKRLDVGSGDYNTIARWIAAGAPGPDEKDPKLTKIEIEPESSLHSLGDKIGLAVTAHFSDGKKRDVTRWAKFTSNDATVAEVDEAGSARILGHGEGSVTAWYSSQIVTARLTVPFENDIPAPVFTDAPRTNFIDDLVLEQLARLKLQPSPPAEDATFVRRAFLDTIGKLPTPEETKAFVEDPDPNKHAKLADTLLARPEFVDYWTYKWADVFLITGSKLRPDAVKAYYAWLRTCVEKNKPWDQIARELVTAKGSSVENGATNFFAVHQDPETMAENVSRAFLSLSIGCAKCHNHPLEKWTNDQYYAFANLFSRVRAKGWGGDPRNGDGKRTLYVVPRGDLIQPRTGLIQPPAPLDASPIDPGDLKDRREVLADWLTSPENPYFARAITNRVWANFMGIGIVESVDDLRASNPASNEKLLARLSASVVENKYDLKSLMRLIVTSQTYRRSSAALPGNKADNRHYSRYYPRRLMAEVLHDAIADITAVPDKFTEIALNDGSTQKTETYKLGTRAIQLHDSAVKSYFLSSFGRNPRAITCECERSNQPSMIQVLHLSNGRTINGKLASKDGRIAKLLAQKLPPSELITQAYKLCLSRPPTEKEMSAFLPILESEATRRETLEDLFWSLLTSREFLFQH